MGRTALVVVFAAAALGLGSSTAWAGWFFGAGFGRALPPSGIQAERTYTLNLGSVSDHGWVGAEADYELLPQLENGGEARTLTRIAPHRETDGFWLAPVRVRRFRPSRPRTDVLR